MDPNRELVASNPKLARPSVSGSSEFGVEKETLHLSYADHPIHLIRAVDRTTHAVRAFVLFLFYQLTAVTLAFVIYLFAEVVGNSNQNCSDEMRAYQACSPNGFLIFIAFAVWVAGVVVSSNIGWNEIKKSEVPPT